jgi:hypothetical protein
LDSNIPTTGSVMRQTQRSGQRDPRHHVEKIAGRLQELIDHLRSDIETIDDPRCKAMFETSAEVLGGLQKALHDYQSKSEPAWR